MSSTSKAAWYWDIIRSLLVSLDNVGFSLLSTVYKIFYTVANATIISGDLIRNFYSRIQLILGILMIFKLAMSILNIIINPDSVKDSKNGPGKIIPRVVVAVFLLLLIIPVEFEIQNETNNNETNNNETIDEKDYSNNGNALTLNAYINDHGILFGFLYKFQDSMMRENIIGKLILGINSGGSSSDDDSELDRDFNSIDANNLSAVGDTIAAQVARMVIRPNVVDESQPYCSSETGGDFDPTNPCPNTRCPAEVVASNYTDETLSASSIADLVNVSCRNNELNKTIYAFSYTPLLGLIVSAVMSFIIIGFTIDVAVRALKLAILRLIAPIPIISYIDPKSEKDGAFGNWLKALISTYVDLFIRLAIIFFGAFIIQSLFSEGTFDSIKSGNALVDIFSKIAIILGLLVFMKQAPTFLKNALGIKSQPMGNAGLSGLLGGAAMAIGGGGLAGFGLGMMQGMNASADAQAQGKAFSPFNSWSQNRDQMAKIRTGDKDARGGIIGGTMDRLLYNTRERQLGIKGLTNDNADLAKSAMYAQQEAVHKAQINRDLAWERLKGAGITADPSKSNLPDLVEPNRDDFTTAAPTDYYGNAVGPELFDQQAYDNAMAEYRSQMAERQRNQALWDDFIKKDDKLSTEQTKSAKMEKNYKNISGARQASGVDPRLYDEYSSGRGRYRAGGKRTRFNPYSEGEPSKIDDTGLDALVPEIGGSPRGGPGGRR